MTRPVIFLDDGGVMNDNRLRAGQWQQLVAEFFTPRLGGTPEGWAAANRVVIEWLFDPDNWEARLRATTTYAEFDRAYMDHMVKDHKKDVAEFKTQAESGKDPQIKAFAAKTLPTLQEHLKLAEATHAEVRKAKP